MTFRASRAANVSDFGSRIEEVGLRQTRLRKQTHSVAVIDRIRFRYVRIRLQKTDQHCG